MSGPENLVTGYRIETVMHDGAPYIQVVLMTMNDGRKVLTQVFHIPLTRAALLAMDVDNALLDVAVVRAACERSSPDDKRV